MEIHMRPQFDISTLSGNGYAGNAEPITDVKTYDNVVKHTCLRREFTNLCVKCLGLFHARVSF